MASGAVSGSTSVSAIPSARAAGEGGGDAQADEGAAHQPAAGRHEAAAAADALAHAAGEQRIGAVAERADEDEDQPQEDAGDVPTVFPD